MIVQVFVYLQLHVFGCIPDRTYHFLDRNCWPVSPDQENDLCVIDTIQNMCVSITWPSDMTACAPAVIQKTSFKSVTLKRSVSMEQHGSKHPR